MLAVKLHCQLVRDRRCSNLNFVIVANATRLASNIVPYSRLALYLTSRCFQIVRHLFRLISNVHKGALTGCHVTLDARSPLVEHESFICVEVLSVSVLTMEGLSFVTQEASVKVCVCFRI